MEERNMEDEKKTTENIREYLRIKKLNDDDKSDEMIEEVYEEVLDENER